MHGIATTWRLESKNVSVFAVTLLSFWVVLFKLHNFIVKMQSWA